MTKSWNAWSLIILVQWTCGQALEPILMPCSYGKMVRNSSFAAISLILLTAFVIFSGKLYFFKGKGFWKFNDMLMRVEKPEQMDSGPFWMGCSKNYKRLESDEGSGHKSIRFTSAGADIKLSSVLASLVCFAYALRR